MSALRKNEIVRVRIEDIGNSGEGIGKADGFTLFVKNTVIGDLADVRVMKMKKHYGYARLENLAEPSPDRTEPACPIAAQCGGCQLQMMRYDAQLRFKERKVYNDLRRIGGFNRIPMEPIGGMQHPFRYRNKAQFPVGIDRDGNPVAGFYAGHSHRIIPCTDCLLGVPQNQEVLDKILLWMRKYHVPAYNEDTGEGVLRHVLIRCGFHSKEMLVCLVVNRNRIPAREALTDMLREIPAIRGITYSVNARKTNVIMGDNIHTLWGSDHIEDMIGTVRFSISPLSFFQVNPVQTEKLYQKVLDYADLTGRETVFDLYCGIGTISLFLAERAKKVYGVEIVPQAVEDARTNAARNGIENAEFMVGKAEEIVPELYRQKGVRADVVVVDPPRKGCDGKLLDTILRMTPEKIVYVSCDPATLARDLAVLCRKDYDLVKVRPYDQFPNTVHVETVVLMSRRSD